MLKKKREENLEEKARILQLECERDFAVCEELKRRREEATKLRKEVQRLESEAWKMEAETEEIQAPGILPRLV